MYDVIPAQICSKVKDIYGKLVTLLSCAGNNETKKTRTTPKNHI